MIIFFFYNAAIVKWGFNVFPTGGMTTLLYAYKVQYYMHYH